jgi:hypothetical protein
MSALRLPSIAGNALLFAWMAYFFPSSHATVYTSDYVFGFGVLTCSGLKLVYLLLPRFNDASLACGPAVNAGPKHDDTQLLFCVPEVFII